ncbi:triacylglycerol lipase 2-like [Zingiber officinale]|uniref:triacylglycerol lipase 2-like n=1 Tax=Zingiber officinale TaxID=94328 RepID=UPI001C4AC046|nr:triacylglycerol lipase 2-like [Zingiber officinale]
MYMASHTTCSALPLLLLLYLFLIVPPQVLVGARSLNGRSWQSGGTTNDSLCELAVIPQGYKCQEYKVQTEDGYILGLQRIPQGRDSDREGKKRQPVLLQHGILVDGMSWALNSPEESLAFILADNGFDVWIANTRGTTWSPTHISLNITDQAFWSFSWDELASYDLPAILDFVYQQTGQKVDYVGHSLGTLMALSSLSQGKLVDKMKSAALLSPIAYLSHITTRLGKLAARVFVADVIKWLGVSEFNLKSKISSDFLNKLCDHPGVDCFDLAAAISGNNCCLNHTAVEYYLKYEPQPTSIKNLIHLAQMVRDGVITKYDYGSKTANMRHYNQVNPPPYDMSNIPKDFPLFLSYGGRDELSDVEDVLQLLDDLKLHDVDKLTVQYVEEYAHLDFILGINAKAIVYGSIISFFNTH